MSNYLNVLEDHAGQPKKLGIFDLANGLNLALIYEISFGIDKRCLGISKNKTLVSGEDPSTRVLESDVLQN